MRHALGLTEEQQKKLGHLKVHVEQRRMDLVAAAERQALDQNSDAYRSLAADNERFRRIKEAEISATSNRRIGISCRYGPMAAGLT